MIPYPNIVSIVKMTNPYPPILQQVEDNGFKVFKTGIYNVNIIGLRTSSREANVFDDKLFLVFRDDFGNWVEHQFKITTDAGTYHLNNPSRVSGTAILVAGQYRGVYRIDFHQGKYKALCQRGGEVKVYRDDNKDTILDHNAESIETGYFGINIHRANANRESTQVEKWSAGCQVFASPFDFDIFMSIIEKSANIWGNSFTYTLLEE